MIAAHNARRRARGEPEVTAAEYELRVASDIHEQQPAARAVPRRSRARPAAGGDQRAAAQAGASRAHARAGSRGVRRQAAGGELSGRCRGPEPDLARCLIIGCGCRGPGAGARADRPRSRGPRDDPRPGARRRDRGGRGGGVVGGSGPVATLIARRSSTSGPPCILLGSATGSPEALAALHGSRLGHVAAADARLNRARNRLRGGRARVDLRFWMPARSASGRSARGRGFRTRCSTSRAAPGRGRRPTRSRDVLRRRLASSGTRAPPSRA